MPKYFYSCQECKHTFGIYHSPKEKLKICPECDTIDGLVRQVNKVFIGKQTLSDTKKVGELTKEFIEDNREILKDIKKEFKDNEYSGENNTD